MPSRIRFAIVTALVIVVMAIAWVMTGVPLRWAKGVVESCKPAADAFECRVELIPGGEAIIATSAVAVASGHGVELRVWTEPVRGLRTYMISR